MTDGGLRRLIFASLLPLACNGSDATTSASATEGTTGGSSGPPTTVTTTESTSTSTSTGGSTTGSTTTTTPTTTLSTTSVTGGPSCGDGEIQADEACDDGNDDSTDSCLDTCELARCGDGFVQMDVEACDDGNDRDDDGCRADCTAPGAAMVFSGVSHTCAVSQAGTVHCWGANEYGQLGHGDTVNIGDDELPKTIGAVELGVKVTSMSLGAYHTCAIAEGGGVRCFGAADSGRLGYGNVDDIGDDEQPSAAGDVDVGGSVTQLATGFRHTCALLVGGKVRCWGGGSDGQLGYGNTESIGDDENPSVAGDVDVGGAAKQLVAGEVHTCALLESGKVRCWGQGKFGALGYGDIFSIGDDEPPSAVGPVDLGAEAVAVAAGSFHTCALTVDQTIRCWGANLKGQLGYGHKQTIGDDELPKVAGDVDLAGDKAMTLALGQVHSCAIVVPDGVRCWGFNSRGQLGQGNIQDIGDNELPGTIAPVDVGAPTAMISASGVHTCALAKNGGVRCWGGNFIGQLGYGNTLNIGDDEAPASAGQVEFLP